MTPADQAAAEFVKTCPNVHVWWAMTPLERLRWNKDLFWHYRATGGRASLKYGCRTDYQRILYTLKTRYQIA